MFVLKIAQPTKVELVTPLLPEECVQKLQLHLGSDSFLGALRRDAANQTNFVGEISSIALRIKKRPISRNSFTATLQGTLEPTTAGAIIRGEIGIDRAAGHFMSCWIVGTGVVASIVLVVVLSLVLSSIFMGRGKALKDLSLMLFFLPIMPVFGYWMLRMSQDSAEKESKEIIEFLSQTIEAQPGGSLR